jgi:hypothetical protein
MAQRGVAPGKRQQPEEPLSIEDEIVLLDNKIDRMNNAIAAYNEHADYADELIERQLEELRRLLERLNRIHEAGSEQFRRKITDMKVKTLKSIQDLMKRIIKRSPVERTVMEKAHELHGINYTEEELRLIVGASDYLRRCAQIEPVVFSGLEREQQDQVEAFFFNEVIPLITAEIESEHVATRGESLKKLTKEVAALKKLGQELLAQMIAEKPIPPGDSEMDQRRRKIIAMTCIITTSATDKGFGDNIGTLLQALTLQDLLKGAFTSGVCIAAAAANPTLASFATSAASMLTEATGAAAAAALESPAVAVGSGWHLARFIDANLPRNPDLRLRDTLLSVGPRRRFHIMTEVFGERTPILGWWDLAGVAKRVFQVFGEGVCTHVGDAVEMGMAMQAAPARIRGFCSRSAESLNSTIGHFANAMASRHGFIDSMTLSRARDVLNGLLDTGEFQDLKDDEFIDYILLRLGLLDGNHDLTEAKFKKYEAELIGTHGLGPEYAAGLLPEDDSMRTGAPGRSESPVRKTVIREPDPPRQSSGLMLGVHDEVIGPRDSAAATDAAAASEAWGEEGSRLLTGKQLAKDNASARGKKGPNKNKSGVVKGKGAFDGGKRTRRRKATTKKQKSKKNKRQSRRKSRRSSSRKAGRK